ncbi:MAG: DNA polymerase IV [Candidatus Ozemobacteraceae bacterium]
MKRIACFDLDAFFVEVALKHHPKLRGLPLAVCGGLTGRSVVCSASYEARRFGVRAAMPLGQARQLCPEIHLVTVPHEVGDVSNRVRERLELICPRVEPASIDEFFLDFTGCDRLYPRNLDLAERICGLIATDPALPATIGFGTNKLIAKIASDLGKPRGILEVFPGAEKRFLASLPLKQLPGVGPKLQITLSGMGLQQIGDILQISAESWQAALGKCGVTLYQQAQGLCDSSVIPPDGRDHRHRISRERTLVEDTSSHEVLLHILSALLEEAARDLRRCHRTCGGLGVKIRYADFTTASRSSRVVRTNDDAILYPIATSLLLHLFTKRQKVRRIGIALDALQSGGVTDSLWQLVESPKRQKLSHLLDRLCERYGRRALMRARSSTHR